MPRRKVALHIIFASLCHSVQQSWGAFTIPTGCHSGYIQQNHQNTWCYYPYADQTRSLSCGGDYASILDVHTRQTTSISYYAPDGTRLGGASWPVPTMNPGQIYLCASGRVGDGTFQTFCATPITQDNSIPSDPGCVAAIAQNVVMDGCYDPQSASASVSAPSSPPPPPQSSTTSVSETSASTSTPTPMPGSSSSSMTTTTASSTTPVSATVTGNSKDTRGLGKSDIIGIVFGLVSALGVGVSLYGCVEQRRRAQV